MNIADKTKDTCKKFKDSFFKIETGAPLFIFIVFRFVVQTYVKIVVQYGIGSIQRCIAIAGYVFYQDTVQRHRDALLVMHRLET